MEDTLKGWFAEFHTYLGYENPALAEKDPDKETAIDAVKAAVCQNINLFMEQNEEEFKDYLNTFVQDVWTLLVAVKQGSGQVTPSASDHGCAEQPCLLCWQCYHTEYVLSSVSFTICPGSNMCHAACCCDSEWWNAGQFGNECHSLPYNSCKWCAS